MSKKTSHSITAGNAKDAPVYHIGLDVHAADFTVAVADPGRGGEVRELGTFSSDLHALEKLVTRLRKAHPGAVLHVAYEAGPTGLRPQLRFPGEREGSISGLRARVRDPNRVRPTMVFR